ncbi:hypothetical protein PMAYCL1PPCAC_21183, partial [Pristionchus mayeri]
LRSFKFREGLTRARDRLSIGRSCEEDFIRMRDRTRRHFTTRRQSASSSIRSCLRREYEIETHPLTYSSMTSS